MSCGEPNAAAISATAAAGSSPESSTVTAFSGRGNTLTVTSSSAARVPQEPASSFGRS